MRAAPAKFLFENDFAAGIQGKPSIALEAHATKVAEAEAAGFARGIEEGRRAAEQEAAQRTAAAIERVAASVAMLDKGLSEIAARLESEAVEVAVSVAKKLVPELIAREPFAEIAALAAGCFRDLVKCPHVVVRVSDALHATAREQLEEIARRRGIDTRLVVLAEPEIATGDCRIEWADGGIDRDSAAIASAIDEAVARYLSGASARHMPDVKWR